MIRRIRRLTALTCAFLVLTLSAIPAAAGEARNEARPGQDSAPAMVDAVVLRPFGLLALGVGTLLFVTAVGPITLLTRPSELGKPWRAMVVEPARYVYADPLGSH